VGLYALSGEKIVWLNARAAELVGCKPEEMVGGSFLEFVYPPDLSLLRAAETARPYVIRAVRRDGQLVHLEVHQRSLEKDGQRLISGAVVDVTARVSAESAERDKLLHDAFHDLLTGLPNRALFLDRLEHRLALGGAARSVLAGRARSLQRRFDRHRPRQRDVRASRGHPSRRGHGAVSREGAGTRPLRRVRRQHARPRRRAPAAGDGAEAGAG